MIAGLEQSEIEDIWKCIEKGIQVKSNSDFQKIIKIVQVMTDCYRNKRLEPAIQSKVLDEKARNQLVAFLKDRLPSEKLEMSWKIGVVVGNNYVQKSLHPVIEMDVEGEKFEVDIDGLGDMRLALAKALLNTEKYE